MAEFLLYLGVISIPLFFAGYILRALDQAAKDRKRPVKLYVIDFFSLLFLMQIPFAILMQRSNEENLPVASFAAGIFSLAMSLVWWTTIKTVSRAGIVRIADRCWISLLVIPMTFVGSFAIVGIALSLLADQASRTRNLVSIEVLLFVLMILTLVMTKRAVNRGKCEAGEIANEAE